MRISLIVFALFFIIQHGRGQGLELVNDPKGAKVYLSAARAKASEAYRTKSQPVYQSLNQLIDLGDWELVEKALVSNKDLNPVERALLSAKLHWLRNDFQAAEYELKKLSNKDQTDYRVQRSFAQLKIEAWELETAEQMAKQLLAKKPNDVETELVLGRALMLQKKYKETLDLANTMIKHNPQEAAGYFLKADVNFWDQNPKEAEIALIEGLKLNPLNADARFYYGYAIWRRIDATQLNDMVAQWELALLINPLHFQSHWHLGNGHTNLTYADYVDANEKEIRTNLETADSLFTANNIQGSFKVIQQVSNKFPNSVLPAMHEASLLYGDFDAQDRKSRLDKSEKLFLDILKKKNHYGPAHNGLAAVIKSKRIPYLKTYSKIMQELRNPKISNMDDFLEIFPDVAYYPGNVAKGMAWNQLYTSTVYFPFLVKQHRLFVIPPLHVDLALAMKSPYFRFNSTFDNRQWMDIRGVGSGAAAIEYVERGAFEERNVLLHEYVHLFHGQVLTDEQNRKIKALYYNAMKNGLTLDYYSQNNESEYFAQTYPAYFEKVKVHPLDFKSMNTLSDLKGRDPEMYAFLDDLIGKEKAYLAGDKKAMASNWSQVYLNLASYAARNDHQEAFRLLDTALQYDKKYLPAILAYADLLADQKQFDLAKARIEEAKQINDKYAPIYLSEGKLMSIQFPLKRNELAQLYQKAYDLETDYMEKARVSSLLRNFYFQGGQLKEALAVADEYVKNGSEISTYLRDRKDDARAFAAWQRALLGDETQIKQLAYLAGQKPQNYSIRTQYVEALLANQQTDEAIKNLKEVYRTLQATQVGRADFELLLFVAYIQKEDKANIQEYLNKLTGNHVDPIRLSPLNNLRLVRLLLQIGEQQKAKDLYQSIKKESGLFYRASDNLTQAMLLKVDGKQDEGLKSLKAALDIYPYQIEAYQIYNSWFNNQPASKNNNKKIKIDINNPQKI
ncbi:tetratricopeptide repeat protein [Sphingobacterium kyonggiense]